MPFTCPFCKGYRLITVGPASVAPDYQWCQGCGGAGKVEREPLDDRKVVTYATTCAKCGERFCGRIFFKDESVQAECPECRVKRKIMEERDE